MGKKHKDKTPEDFLMHYGVLGMKWGVRKDRGGSVTTSRKAKDPASLDSTTAAASKAKAARSGSSSLSNQELRGLNDRLQLEKTYAQLVSDSPTAISKGQAHVKKAVSVAKTAQEVYNTVNSPMAKEARSMVEEQLRKRKK